MARPKRDDHVIRDDRTLPIFIHSVIDDMTDLSPDTMRVYMHLSRRADKSGAAWPSYQSIGDHCFKTVYKHADGRRKHAVAAVAALVTAGLIKKERRMTEHGQQTNAYVLLDPVTVASQPGVILESQPGGDCSVTGFRTLASQPAVTVASLDPVTVASPKDTPLEGTPKQKEEEDHHPHLLDRGAADLIEDAWTQTYGDTIPENLLQSFGKLLIECGPAAVCHGIRASTGSESRSFKYIAACARNYVPPANGLSGPNGRHSNGKSYRVDLPGVYALQPAPTPTPPPALPAVTQQAGDWATILGEMRRTQPGGYMSFLEGSRAEMSTDGACCRIILARANAPLEVLRSQLTGAIQRKFKSILHHPVLIEIVAAEPQPEPTP